MIPRRRGTNPSTEVVDEGSIQKHLFHWLRQKGHEYICPNSGVFGWEADLVSVTGAGFAHEYEVKISRSDFRTDAKKLKHQRLLKADRYKKDPTSVQFWYVVPAGLVSVDEVPQHAGLLEIRRGYIKLIKNAPRLHSYKATEIQLRYLARGLMCRFWNPRRDRDGERNCNR